jgi:hypothetical protein
LLDCGRDSVDELGIEESAHETEHPKPATSVRTTRCWEAATETAR